MSSNSKRSTQNSNKPPAPPANSPSRSNSTSNPPSGKVPLPAHSEISAGVTTSSVASQQSSVSSSKKIDDFINAVTSAPLKYANGSGSSTDSSANASANVPSSETIDPSKESGSSLTTVDHDHLGKDSSEKPKSNTDVKPMDVEEDSLISNAQKKYAERELSFVNPYSWQEHNRPVLRVYANARSRFSKFPSSRSSTYAQCNYAVTAALHAIKNTKALVEPFREMHGSECIVLYIDKEDVDTADKAKVEILNLPAVRVIGDDGNILNTLTFSDSFVNGPSPSNIERYDVFPVMNVECGPISGTVRLDKLCEVMAMYLNVPADTIAAKFYIQARAYSSTVLFGFKANFDDEIFPDQFPVPADYDGEPILFKRNSWYKPCRCPPCLKVGEDDPLHAKHHTFLDCKKKIVKTRRY